MNTIVLIKGIAFILVSFYCYRLAYLQFKKTHYNLALLFILFGGLLIRVWCISDPFLHDWDERYHALVAKNLAVNPLKPTLFINPLLEYDFRQWTLNHVWLHKQPLALWLISLSIKIFGNNEIAVRLPSLILSLIAIGLTFKIALFFTQKIEKALIAAFLHSINGFLIEISSGRGSTDHIDSIFFFFIELAIVFIIFYIERQKILFLLGIGVLLGMSFLTKSFPALIIIPIYYLLCVKKDGFKKSITNVLLILLIAFCVYSPWQLYIFNTFPNEAKWENHYNFLHLTSAVEGHAGEWWWHLDYARRVWNELIYLIFIWFLFQLNRNFRNTKLWVLLIWIMIPYIFFSSVNTKMYGYIIFTAPAIFIIEAIFLWDIKFNYAKFPWLRTLLFYAVIILAIRYCYERVMPFSNENYDKQLVENNKLKALSKYFSKGDINVVFGLNRYIECMFYHENTVAYPFIPNSTTIDSLSKLDYKIYIINTKNEQKENLNNSKVHYLDF